MTGPVSRRRVLGVAGVGALTGAAGIAGFEIADAQASADGSPDASGLTHPFHGTHQAGIVTPAQDRLHFASFDVTTGSRDALVALLGAWTEAAAAMTAGRPVGAGTATSYDSPPTDTGEALGLPPAGLTLTFGFGPTLFEKDGEDRFGLAGRRPAALRRLPHFPADNLDPARSDGDLCVQACANDPQVAVHAIRNLARIGFGTVALRWSQLGFGKTSSTTPEEQTPRNLFGFKDGTNNIAGGDTAALDEHIWVGPQDDPQWMRGGSYLVARRIRMIIEIWDRTSLGEQERIIGRDKREGAPLGLRLERDPIDMAKQPAASHIKLAAPANNDGVTILRRGYSFVDGSDGLGRLDAGLFFLAYQRDPRTGFVAVQRKLARADVLNEYIRHTGSGLYACPPGVTGPDRWWGDTLFS